MKCKCGRPTANLSGICSVCLSLPNAPQTTKAKKARKPRKNKQESRTSEPEPVVVEKKYKCGCCTMKTANESKVCDACTEIANRPKQCPRCLSEMELVEGYLGMFWSCCTFPRCKGTITAKGTYMRKFSNGKPKE